MGIFDSNNGASESVVKRPGPDGLPQTNNIIGRGTVIEGAVHSKADIHIAGDIKGDVRVDGRAAVSQEGVIRGTLMAANADISGTIEGDVTVEARLHLRGTAKILGNIRTSKLVIEDGAVFSGKCDMSAVLAPPVRPPADVKKPA